METCVYTEVLSPVKHCPGRLFHTPDGPSMKVRQKFEAVPNLTHTFNTRERPAETLENRAYISGEVPVRLYCEAVFSTTPHAFVTGATPSTLVPFTTDHMSNTSFGFGDIPGQIEDCTVAS